MLLTDPPYNVNVSNSKGMTIANDNMGKSEFAAFLNSAMSNAVYALKPGGAFYVWYSHSEEIAFRSAMEAAGGAIKQTLIWNKTPSLSGDPTTNGSTSRAFTDGKRGQRTGSETSSTIRRSSRMLSMWTR